MNAAEDRATDDWRDGYNAAAHNEALDPSWPMAKKEGWYAHGARVLFSEADRALQAVEAVLRG